jgi:hypothetical protein
MVRWLWVASPRTHLDGTALLGTSFYRRTAPKANPSKQFGHQIEFFFDQDSLLLFTPSVEPKGEWLRFPVGQVVVMPNESELRLKAKAEVAAIKHVAERKRLSSNKLWGSARRAAKSHTWEVVVLRDSLEVDTPTYILEVTDDGRITELRPIPRTPTTGRSRGSAH